MLVDVAKVLQHRQLPPKQKDCGYQNALFGELVGLEAETVAAESEGLEPLNSHPVSHGLILCLVSQILLGYAPYLFSS